ncbi:MAG: PAS domain S-box protein [Actinomycetota bacterium]|nr:PAS domain S-box protein [Actinomycetota bacterium]
MRAVARLRHALPQGRTLPDDAWQKRHRALSVLLWLHALLLPVFALVQGYGALHSLTEGSVLAVMALAAYCVRSRRRIAATLISLGLITASALIVHVSGGVIEAHFHFFVMIVVLALYEDWLPFLISAAYVVIHHGLTGALAPHEVYNHPDAVAHPWKWAAIHGAFVAAAGIASVVAWRLNEGARAAAVGAQRDAAEARAHLVALVDSSGDAIIGSALDGSIVSWNRGAEELFGYRLEEVLGRSVGLLVPPDRHDEARAVRHMTQTERVDHLETDWIAKGGRPTDVSLTISPIKSADGELSGASMIARDVTERRRTERYLDVQHQAARLMAESPTIDEALHALLRVIGEGMGWPVGACWMATAEGPPIELGCVAFWQATGRKAQQLAAVSRSMKLAPGIGLPGRVWESRQARWVSDVTREPHSRRSGPAAADGLHACFLLPVPGGTDTRAVLEFFSYEVRSPDSALLEMLDALSGQIGQFLERKRAEAALAASERETRQILETAHDAFIAIDSDGAITDWNPQAESTFGWPCEDVLGRDLADTIVPEPQREAHRRGMERFLATGEGPVLGRLVELPALHRDGHEFPIELTISPVRTEHGYSFNAFVRDITERKAAAELLERQRRQLVDAQSVGEFGSWEWDIVENKTEWSDELYRIYGLEPSEEPMTFEGFLRRVHPDDRATVRATVEAACATVEAFSFEHRIVRPDGTVRVHQARGEVIVGEGGVPLRMLGTGQDITERHEAERAKDEFTSVVSHELRTPLTSIRGSLGLLESGVLGALPPKGQRMVEIAVQNTDRLVRLINDILDIERIGSGTIDMHPQRCSAMELIERAAEGIAAVSAEARVSLALEAEPVALVADADRVIQTLTNLISNAIKFSAAGSTVRICSQRRDDEVLFRVCDEGRGIPSDKLASIFERFQQVDASDSREKGGTGLGLAICRTIVEHHGGRIWVESELGRGSTFSFVLPALSDEGLACGEAPSGDGPLVLVCDDDASVVEVVGAMLERRGYRVIAARCGEQALERALVDRPDAILLDLLMPGMSGWETLAALKDQPETDDIPIVILSVLAQAEAEAPSAPVSDWLEKPLDEAALFEALRRAVNPRDKPYKVLIVEDDPDLAAILTAIFERHEIETFHAADGGEAIELSQQVLPDLLVLDIGLPETDGFQVVDWLRHHERLSALPMVVYTAHELDEADRERLRLGASTEFLTKGRITPQDFEQRVVRLLARLTQQPTPGSDHAQAHPVGR